MAETKCLDREMAAPLPNSIAALESLTGPSRGTVLWIYDDAVRIEFKAWRLSLSTSAIGAGPAETVARLRRSESSFEIEAAPGQSLWVNGARIIKNELSHGDVVEFGEAGPLSCFRLYDSNHKML